MVPMPMRSARSDGWKPRRSSSSLWTETFLNLAMVHGHVSVRISRCKFFLSCWNSQLTVRLEMTKLLPQLLRAYTITLVDPEVEWELHDFWFVKQKGLITTVTPRVVTT